MLPYYLSYVFVSTLNHISAAADEDYFAVKPLILPMCSVVYSKVVEQLHGGIGDEPIAQIAGMWEEAYSILRIITQL
ncbi:hypothetical protein D9M72_616340 [compost metagenome]